MEETHCLSTRKKIQDFNFVLQKWSINCLLSVLGCSWDLITAEKPHIKFLGRDGAKAEYGGIGTTLSSTSRAAAGAKQRPTACVSTAVNGDATFENMVSALLFLELNKYLLFPHFTRPLQNDMIKCVNSREILARRCYTQLGT